MPPHPAVFVKKSVYDRIGMYKIDYRIASDFEFMIRLFLIDRVRYKYLPHRCVRMRTGGLSTSGWGSKIIISREMLRALRVNNIYSCYPMILLRLPIKFFF